MFILKKWEKGALRFKIPLLIPLVSSISLTLTLWSVYSDHKSALEKAKTSELKTISDQFSSDILKIAGKAESRADMIATIPSVGEAFKNEDREWLTTQLKPMFLEQQKYYDISEMQFHKAPAFTFLKLHKDGDYGEDLSDFRQTVVSTNKLKSPQRGLELGRAGLGIRGVVPVFHEKEHIGSLELVFSFKSLLNKIKKVTGADLSIFVNKKLYDRICTQISNEQEKKEKKLTDEQIEIINKIGNFRYLDSTNKEKVMSLITSTYLNKSTEFYTVFPIVNCKEEGLSLEPLFDFSGARIGTVVISKNFDMLNEQYRAKFIANILIKLGQLSLVLIIALFVYNVWFMKPLHKIKTALLNSFQGNDEALNNMVTEKDNEIENLASILKKVCEIPKDKNKS